MVFLYSFTTSVSYLLSFLSSKVIPELSVEGSRVGIPCQTSHYCSLDSSQLCRVEDCSSTLETCTASSSPVKASPYEASRYHQLAFHVFYDSRL